MMLLNIGFMQMAEYVFELGANLNRTDNRLA